MGNKKMANTAFGFLRGILKQGVMLMTAGAGFLKVLNLIFNDWYAVIIVLLINLVIQFLKKYDILKTPLIKIIAAFVLGILFTICYKAILVAFSGIGYSGFWASSSLWSMALLTGPSSVFLYELFEKILHKKILSNPMALEIYNDVYIITKNKTIANLVACVFLELDSYPGTEEVAKIIKGLISDSDFEIILSHIDSIAKKHLVKDEDTSEEKKN